MAAEGNSPLKPTPLRTRHFLIPSVEAAKNGGCGAPWPLPARSPLWSIATFTRRQVAGCRRTEMPASPCRARSQPRTEPPHRVPSGPASSSRGVTARSCTRRRAHLLAPRMLMSSAGRAAPINCWKYLLTYQMGSRGAKLEGRVSQHGSGTELPAPASQRAAGAAQLQQGR